MPHVRWKLAEYVKDRNLNGYVIAKEMIRVSDHGRPSTVYRLLGDDPPTRVDLDTLTALISALRSLLKTDNIFVEDLLEYVDAQEERWRPPPPRRTGGGGKHRAAPSDGVGSGPEEPEF